MTWEYIAGFFDGEGCVLISQNHKYGYSPRVDIAQSGAIGVQVLTAIQTFLLSNGIVSTLRYQAPTGLSKLPLYRLIISNRTNCTAFLNAIVPHAITKKLEAQDILRHLKLYPALPKGGKLSWESRQKSENVSKLGDQKCTNF